MNVIDYSRRRGAIVHLWPKVYSILNESSVHAYGGRTASESSAAYHIWSKEMNKAVVDNKYRWLFAMQGTNEVWGVLFYHVDGNSIYIDTLAATRQNSKILEALIVKFEREDAIKSAENFYVSRNVKKEEAEEMLETVGLQNDSVFDDRGYQLLGGLIDALRMLRLRYLR